MKKIFASLIVAVGLMVGGAGVTALVAAPTAQAQLGSGVNKTKSADGGKFGGRSVDGLIRQVVNILLYVIGVVAVVMIIIGGIKYATSAGDASKATSAKNTILYAVVGLVVAAFAYAIVNFVVNEVTR